MDEVGEFMIVLGYLGNFVAGADLQKLINQQLNTMEQTMPKIWFVGYFNLYGYDHLLPTIKLQIFW